MIGEIILCRLITVLLEFDWQLKVAPSGVAFTRLYPELRPRKSSMYGFLGQNCSHDGTVQRLDLTIPSYERFLESSGGQSYPVGTILCATLVAQNIEIEKSKNIGLRNQLKDFANFPRKSSQCTCQMRMSLRIAVGYWILQTTVDNCLK
jgi:hypothetical protein